MPQPIVYLELGATNVVRAAIFYMRVFDWQFSDPNQTTYSTFSSGDSGIGGGIYRTDTIKTGGGMVPYIYVEDIEASCARVVEEGGRIVVAKSDIPGTGWFAHFKDLDGNLLGLFTPKSM